MSDEHVKILDSRSFLVTALIWRAEDVEGTWLAHCPELDVVSMGNSAEHAALMINDALTVLIEDDLNAGFEPLDRGPNLEIAERVKRILRSGRKLDRISDSTQRDDVGAIAIEWTMRFDRVAHGSDLRQIDRAFAESQPHAA